MKKPNQKNVSIITLLLLFFTVLIIIGAFHYDRSSRMLPLIVGIPTFLMLVYLVLGETIFPRLISGFNIDLLNIEKAGIIKPSGDDIAVTARWTKNKRYLFITGWLISFLILIILFGYNISTCVGVFLFVKIYGTKTWLRSVLVAISIWAFTYIVFQYAMGMEMFPGIIFGGKVVIAIN